MKKKFILLIIILTIQNSSKALKKKIRNLNYRKSPKERKLLSNTVKALLAGTLGPLATLTGVHVLDTKTKMGKNFFDYINTRKPPGFESRLEKSELLMAMDESNRIYNQLKMKEGNFEILQQEENEKASNINNYLEDCENNLIEAEGRFSGFMANLRNNGESLAKKIFKKILKAKRKEI